MVLKLSHLLITWAWFVIGHAFLLKVWLVAADTWKMYLMYYLNKEGNRVYTLKKVGPDGTPTVSAHPGFACFPYFVLNPLL